MILLCVASLVVSKGLTGGHQATNLSWLELLAYVFMQANSTAVPIRMTRLMDLSIHDRT